MSDVSAAIGALLLVAAVLAATHAPLGAYLARTFEDGRHLRIERALYRLCRVNPDGEQNWASYAGAVLAFSTACVLGLWGLLLVQTHLPLAAGREGMNVDTALNTAVSFVTNTNWQSYGGETRCHPPVPRWRGSPCRTSSRAATGLAVAIALVRALARDGDGSARQLLGGPRPALSCGCCFRSLSSPRCSS
jgi:K+-transporting ATPase ATPase A chain